MFFSKIWTLLVTLFAIVITVAFLLAPKPAEYRLDESLENQVDVAQGLIDMHLRSESRKRLDVLSNIGKDPRLAKPLLALVKAVGEAATTQQQQLTKLLKDANQKSGLRAKTLFLTDSSGRVRAAVGGGGKVDDSLFGLPEIKAALRGTCIDNTLLRGDKLYWVYACPARYVRPGDKIQLAGAVRAENEVDHQFVMDLMRVIGAQESKKSAQESKKSAQESKKGSKKKTKKKADISKLKTELCFYAQGRPVAWTSASPVWAKHGPKLRKRFKKELTDVTIGRSPAVIVTDGKHRFLMVVGMLRGSAHKGGNYWAILWKFPEALGTFAFRSAKIPRSYLLRGFPYVLLIVAGIVALVLGLFFIIWEGDLPLRRLLNQTRAVAAGEAEKVDDRKFRGKFRLAAIAINESVERAAEAGTGKPELHKKNLDAILGDLEPRVAEEDYTPPPPGAVAHGDGAPPPKPDGAGPPPVPPSQALTEPAPLDSMLPPAEPGPMDSALPPAHPGGSQAPFGGHAGIRPSTLPAETPASTAGFAGEPGLAGPIGSSPSGVPAEVEAHFREVFDLYLQAKQQCGEDVSTLSHEQFSAQLKKNREQIMSTQKCRGVRFEVYVKAGKASIKAHPEK